MRGICILFNCDFESPPIDTSKIFGFQITAYPPVKPKYTSLCKLFNGDHLTLYEVGQGSYRLERTTSLVEATGNLTPNLWEEQTKNAKSPLPVITFFTEIIILRKKSLTLQKIFLPE